MIISNEGPAPVRTTLVPTPEQEACRNAFLTGENMTISAGAGTGKTSTLRVVAAAAPGRRGIYLAYNKAIAEEAQQSFPSSVTCRTAHSLAFRWAARNWPGSALQDRLRGNRITPVEVAKILGAKDHLRFSGGLVLAPYQVGRIAMETVQTWCYTDDEQPEAWHVPVVPRIDSLHERGLLADVVVPLARKAWADLSQPHGRLRFTHDNYLKMYCLTRPKLRVDYVLLDEAQDANPLVTGLLRDQTTQIVAVGDASQAIYGWRGACDAMEAFDSRHHLQLTNSWRFGGLIASEANKWLEILEADLRVAAGDPRRPSALRPLGADAKAVLCRTNASVVAEVVASHVAGRSVAIVGGGEEVVRFAQAARELKDRGRTGHPDLFPFKEWGEVQRYVEDSHDGKDLAVWVKLIDEHQPEGVIDAVSKCVNYGYRGQEALVAEQKAQLVVSTAHKAKGREWPTVRVSNDFADQEPQKDPVTGHTPKIDPAEAMLAYVTVTRAQEVLDTGGLAWVDQWAPARTASY